MSGVNDSGMGFYTVNIKVKIGQILFNIILDKTFFDLNDNSIVENHNHSTFEIHFIVKGTGFFDITGTIFPVSEGNYYIVKPGLYHGQTVGPSEHFSKLSFRMDFKIDGNREDFYPIEETSKILDVMKSFDFFYTEDRLDNMSLLCEIRSEINNKLIGYYSKIQSLFTQFLVNLIRDISSKQKIDYNIPERIFDENRLLIIDHFFEHNYNLNSTAGDLAKVLHLSVRQLDRILKDSYNLSFKKKLLEKRLEISKSMLKNTSMLVKDISGKVGYDAESSFSTVFKQKTGCSPNEYRRRNPIKT